MAIDYRSMKLADVRSARARQVEELERITLRNEGRDEMAAGDQQRYADVCRALDKADARLAELRSAGPSQEERKAAVAGLLSVDGATTRSERQAVVARMSAHAAALGLDEPPAARSAGFNVTRSPGADIFDRSGLHPEDERDGPELRDRALRAIDGWRSSTPEAQASAARLVNDPTSERDRQIADLHILGAGSPKYVAAFKTMLRTRPTQDAMGNPVPSVPLDLDLRGPFNEVNERAVNEGTIGAGLAMVPPMYDPTISMVGTGAEPAGHPFRALVDVKTITTKVYLSASANQVTAAYDQEATEAPDAAGTFGAISITPLKGDAFFPVSWEFLDDAGDAMNQLMTIFSDARWVLESVSWVNGLGTSQTPQGVTTALDLTTASRTSTAVAGSFTLPDAYTAFGALPARYRPNSVWVGNDLVWNTFRQTTAASPQQIDREPWRDFPDGPPKLISRPVYSASGFLGTQTTGADLVVIGDWRAGCTIVERAGTGVALYNRTALIGAQRRLSGQTAVYCMWRSVMQVVNPAALQMIRGS